MVLSRHISSNETAHPLDAITGATKMTEDPMMRYIDVLKMRISHLEKDHYKLINTVEHQKAIIAAYSKITKLTISANEDKNDDEQLQYD